MPTARAAAALVLLLAAGCGPPRADRPEPVPVRPPDLSEAAATPPRPVVDPTGVPVRERWEGVYVLARVDSLAVPARVGAAAEPCAPVLTQATLTLIEDRFSYSQTAQEGCGTERTTVVRRAAGEFDVDVASVELRADSGQAFTRATGVFLRDGELQLVEVAGPDGARGVRWRFHRQPEPPPVE